MANFYFDMDGTIFDLYGVDGWLDDLINSNPRPYEIAKPLVNFSRLAKAINKARRNGNKVSIISWLSKNSTEAYDEAVTIAKINAIRKHFPSVWFDEVYIIPYGTPKSSVAEYGILFDDEERNLNEWVNSGMGEAFTPDKIFEVLAARG